MRGVSLAALSLAALLGCRALAAEDGYAISGRTPGPDASVWDYAVVDTQSNRLLLSTGGTAAGAVTVLDLATRQAVSLVPGIPLPHGIAPLGDGTAAIADGSHNRIVLFDEASGAVKATITAGKPPHDGDWHTPDTLLLDPSTRQLVAVEGDSGQLVLIDAQKHEVTGRIAIGGHLEAADIEGNGTLFVNIASRNAVGIVDLARKKLVKTVPLKNCDEPTGLAYEPHLRLVISVCSNGIAKFVDPASGSEIASLAVGKGADAVMFDPNRHVAFTAGGEDGTLSIIRMASRETIAVAQTLQTQRGMRLGAVDAATGTLYLPIVKRDRNGPPIRLPGIDPIPAAVPGSFEFVEVSPR